MTVEYSASTNKGRRSHNRDAFAAGGAASSPAVEHQTADGRSETGFAVFTVCDGVGDSESSGDAAVTAAGYIARKAENSPCPENAREAYEWINDTLIEAKSAVFDRQSDKKTAYDSFFRKLQSVITGGKKGVYDTAGSSTVSVLTVFPGGFLFANCGDSPCFILRGGVLTELSVRHNAAADGMDIQFDGGRSAESVLLHDLKEAPRGIPVFTSAVAGDLNEDAVFLICSDGVTSAVSEDVLAEMLENGAAADEITALALSSGSTDNCTAVTVKINI